MTLVSGQGEIQRSDARSRKSMEQPSSGRLTDRCRVRVNGIGVIEVVVRMDVGFIRTVPVALAMPAP